MDRIRELVGRITELSDEELVELRDLILAELDGTVPAEGEVADVQLSVLEELAEASDAWETENNRRAAESERKGALASKLAAFRGGSKDEETPDAGAEAAVEAPAEAELSQEAPAVSESAPVAVSADTETELATQIEEQQTTEAPAEESAVTAGADEETAVEVPEDRKPNREVARTTVIRAGADLPGFAMGSELRSRAEIADAMTRRISTMRGIRGGDGDKLIVASATLEGVGDERRLTANNAEENLRKVQALTSPRAIVAAGGLGAPEEVRYDLYDLVGVTDRPVRDVLPVFVTERGGIRFMKAPTLADVNGVTGLWTIEDDIDALTDPLVRKPSFRVQPGPEVVVDTQAITMIMTFGNLMTRAYPELVARHTELALVAHARVAEQLLLTQIGALSTAVDTTPQVAGAVQEILYTIAKAVSGYRNRHRMTTLTPLRAILPAWFKEVLKADLAFGEGGLQNFAAADAAIEGFFRASNVNVTWALDGEAGQDYAAITETLLFGGAGQGNHTVLADFPDEIIWYLFAEGTFSFMDGGTLDLGLVRDSTLNAANDYQTFVETFENVVKFGSESLRIRSAYRPTGAAGGQVTLTPAPGVPVV
jgi:Ni,Fe-hydrogenase III small subunit